MGSRPYHTTTDGKRGWETIDVNEWSSFPADHDTRVIRSIEDMRPCLLGRKAYICLTPHYNLAIPTSNEAIYSLQRHLRVEGRQQPLKVTVLEKKALIWPVESLDIPGASDELLPERGDR